MKELKIVGGYIRVSTEEQSRKGLSLESQKTDIEEYCKRNGYQLKKLYIDRGISARKHLHKRTAFMEMMNDAKSKKINHIVVIRLDRFFRNVYDYHRMMHEYLDPASCGWSAVKEEYDTTTTNGRLMINLRLSIAEQEADTDSDRIKDVFNNRIKEGFVVSGSVPLGYKIEGKRLVKSEDADMVKDIFESYVRMSSVGKVMEHINAKYDTAFDYSTIARLLNKEIYIGKKRSNVNYCEPIVSHELFDTVKRIHPMSVRNRKTKITYVFGGLLFCDDCGFRLSGYMGRGNKYYRCNNSYQNKACSNRSYIREDEIEKYLLENVEALLEQYISEINTKERSAPITKSNREQIQRKIDRVTELFINGIIDMPELKKRKAELEAQIVDGEETPKTDLRAVNKFLKSGFRNIYGNLTDEEKQSMWRTVLREIRISGKNISSITFL